MDVKPVPAKNLAQFDAKQEEADMEKIEETEIYSEEESTSDDPQSSSTPNDEPTDA